MNEYKLATQNKFRYATPIGNISTEDLWDLELTNEHGKKQISLNAIAKSIAKELKEINEEDFVQIKPKSDITAILEAKLAIVKDIITSKIEREKQKSDENNRKERNAKILEIIAEKQNNALASKSIDELMELMK